MNIRARLALAGMAAMLGAAGRLPEAFEAEAPPPPTPSQTKRWRSQRGYPQTGTGKRQGERLARLMVRALGDPYAASNKCLARIHAKAGSVKGNGQ